MNGREFTDREYTVIKNVWGEHVPQAIDDISQDKLWDIKHRTATATLESRGEDTEMQDLMLQIESKVAYVLSDKVVMERDTRPRP